MRVSFCGTLLVMFAIGIATSQDVNFGAGPQYLAPPSSSPLFLRPISPPTLSLNGPPLGIGASDATGILIPGASNQTVVPPLAVALPPIDLLPVFYGVRVASAVEINLTGAPEESLNENSLPPSITEEGVSEMTTMQALRERGYGIRLAEAAERSKARSHPVARTYTNADIDRLHSHN